MASYARIYKNPTAVLVRSAIPAQLFHALNSSEGEHLSQAHAIAYPLVCLDIQPSHQIDEVPIGTEIDFAQYGKSIISRRLSPFYQWHFIVTLETKDHRRGVKTFFDLSSNLISLGKFGTPSSTISPTFPCIRKERKKCFLQFPGRCWVVSPRDFGLKDNAA